MERNQNPPVISYAAVEKKGNIKKVQPEHKKVPKKGKSGAHAKARQNNATSDKKASEYIK